MWQIGEIGGNWNEKAKGNGKWKRRGRLALPEGIWGHSEDEEKQLHAGLLLVGESCSDEDGQREECEQDERNDEDDSPNAEHYFESFVGTSSGDHRWICERGVRRVLHTIEVQTLMYCIPTVRRCHGQIDSRQIIYWYKYIIKDYWVIIKYLNECLIDQLLHVNERIQHISVGWTWIWPVITRHWQSIISCIEKKHEIFEINTCNYVHHHHKCSPGFLVKIFC